MFDFDASKLLIVGVIALVFIPPKDLPRVLRQVGQFVGKMRRVASEFQGQFMDAMREADMADLREEARKLADATKIDIGLNAVTDLGNHLTGAIEGKPMMMEATPSPVDPAPSAEVGPGQPRQVTAERSVEEAAIPVPADASGLARADVGASIDGSDRELIASDHHVEARAEAPAMSSSA